MAKLAAIFFSMVLVDNYILVKFLGICPFLGVSKKLDSSVGMSIAVIFVMMMATAVTWPMYTFILVPFGLEYLETISFILVIASLVQLVDSLDLSHRKFFQNSTSLSKRHSRHIGILEVRSCRKLDVKYLVGNFDGFFL